MPPSEVKVCPLLAARRCVLCIHKKCISELESGVGVSSRLCRCAHLPMGQWITPRLDINGAFSSQ